MNKRLFLILLPALLSATGCKQQKASETKGTITEVEAHQPLPPQYTAHYDKSVTPGRIDIEKALADHDKAGDIKVGRIDFETTLGDYLKEGTFNVSYGGQQQIDPRVSAVVLVNKVIGTPIVEEGPTNIITPYLDLL